jgi:hypothetical protein
MTHSNAFFVYILDRFPAWDLAQKFLIQNHPSYCEMEMTQNEQMENNLMDTQVTISISLYISFFLHSFSYSIQLFLTPLYV